MRKWEGNRPIGDGWGLELELIEMYESEWEVYTRDTDENNVYLTVKVVACDPVINKANYWLWFNKNKKTFGSRSDDLKLLKKNRPDLFNAIKKNFDVYYGD